MGDIRITNRLVNVVIPCFNSGLYLREAVTSALAQTYEGVIVTVVDDGSTDKSTRDELEVVSSWERVRLLRQQNKGPSAARNAGILASDAEFILPLDADDLIHPNYVSQAVQVLQTMNDVGLVYSKAEFVGHWRGEWSLPEFSWNILVHNCIFNSCLYRKSSWEAAGGYDTSFRDGREDHDFILKLLGLGLRPHRIDEVMFSYRISMNSRNSNFAKSRGALISASARMFRNNLELYSEHADSLFELIFSMQDEINDLKARYRTFERLRNRFPKMVHGVRDTFRKVRRWRR